MKKIAIAAALLVGFAANAHAASIISATVIANGSTNYGFTLVDFGSGGATNLIGRVNGQPASVDIEGAGFTVNSAGESGVFRGDVTNQTKSPFRDGNGAPTAQHYLNRRAGTGNTMEIVFDTAQTAFNLLWGSYDISSPNYNLLSFKLGSETINGQDLQAYLTANSISASPGNTNLAVQIQTVNPFTSIIVSADNQAFEFAPGVAVNQVPDGGTTLALLGGVLVGLGALRRKFNV